ncbi:MAG: bifunctional biotin--[acetyl-CoA-carboxylase] synthetase/biotin operon repressor, partial [Candidatus Omnitrophica bacterium]|nr:bifunctional biotin--[acetyl-CoA-carboxylase] synthetase/biotin operon repressor [Candidatus Omnitrophota bacterium]
GILTEIKAQPDMVDFMVLGIGINVNTARSELPPEGTSLAEEVGGWLDRTVFLRAFMGELEKDYFLLLKEGFGVFRASLRSVSSVIGRHIKIRRGKSLVYAEALDIDEIGALVLRFEDGTVRSVYSGDVSIVAR